MKEKNNFDNVSIYKTSSGSLSNMQFPYVNKTDFGCDTYSHITL